MTLLSHFVTGAAVCRYVRWYPAGLGLAFASHLALDALPHFEHASLLSPAAHPFGCWAPRILSLLTIPLLWLLWRHASARAGWRLAAYMVAGGLLACLLDGLTTLLGHRSVPGVLNNVPHLAWAPAYRQTVAAHGVWSPLAAPFSIAVELLVLALAGWLLFRKRNQEG